MIDKADKILAKYEDDNEYHFHECDRAWIIGAMIELAESEVKKLNIHDVSKSVCRHCGYTYDTHSEVGKLCPDRMKHFETVC